MVGLPAFRMGVISREHVIKSVQPPDRREPTHNDSAKAGMAACEGFDRGSE
jgi:hypothetical protein